MASPGGPPSAGTSRATWPTKKTSPEAFSRMPGGTLIVISTDDLSEKSLSPRISTPVLLMFSVRPRCQRSSVGARYRAAMARFTRCGRSGTPGRNHCASSAIARCTIHTDTCDVHLVDLLVNSLGDESVAKTWRVGDLVSW